MTDLRKLKAQFDAGHNFASLDAGTPITVYAEIAVRMQGKNIASLADWRPAVAEAYQSLGNQLAQAEIETPNPQLWHEERQRLKKAFESIVKVLCEAENASSSAPADSQKMLQTLYARVEHQKNLFDAGVPVNVMAPVDLTQRSNLQKSSSEPVVLNLEKVLERGQFERNEHMRGPMADISGTTGREEIRASAELWGIEGESDLDRQATGDAHAEWLRDPMSGGGVKTAQAVQALMTFWLTKKDSEGRVTVTIAMLAEAMGYTPNANGHHPDHYKKVRECIDVLRTVNLHAQSQLINKKTGTARPLTVEGAGWNFTFINDTESGGRASKGWTAIKYSMGEVLRHFAGRDQAFLMGRDFKLNKLNPLNHRFEVLLGKYLENQFRLTWNNTPGTVTRSVYKLLTDGAGLSAEEAHRPATATLDRLEEKLEKLQKLETVRAFYFDGTVTDVRERLQQKNGRMTQRRWDAVLISMVTIESGKQYNEHMKNHGLTYTGKRQGRVELHPVILETLQLLQTTNRSQATLAAEIGITPAALSKYLAGKHKPPAQVIEKLEEALENQRQQQRQQQLPLA